jgi:hypothetical protein
VYLLENRKRKKERKIKHNIPIFGKSMRISEEPEASCKNKANASLQISYVLKHIPKNITIKTQRHVLKLKSFQGVFSAGVKLE